MPMGPSGRVSSGVKLSSLTSMWISRLIEFMRVKAASVFQCRVMRLTRCLLFASVCSLCLSPAVVRAELAYFHKGGEVQAPMLIDGKRAVVELPGRSVEFRREDFKKIVPAFVPRQEWNERLKRAEAQGFNARYEAAWWAI